MTWDAGPDAARLRPASRDAQLKLSTGECFMCDVRNMSRLSGQTFCEALFVELMLNLMEYCSQVGLQGQRSDVAFVGLCSEHIRIFEITFFLNF